MRGILIPKLFHWIWFGPNPIPDHHRRWIDGWLSMHPGWDHKIWTDANRPTFINERQFLAATNFAQMADIARYELVYRYGGIYLDTDTECLRSIEPLLGSVEAFVVEGEPHTIEASPLGATVAHRWLSDVISRLPQSMETGWGNMHQTGPRFLTTVTEGRSEVTVFPERLFTSDPVDEAKLKEGYSIHHWERSWNTTSEDRFKIKMRQLINEDIHAVVPPGSVFVLVDKGLGLDAGGGRRSVPFPERDGNWAGYPADDAAAIAELERLSQAGADFIVFPSWMFYWLDCYSGLGRFLQTEGRCLVDNDRARIFRVKAEPAVPKGVRLDLNR